VDIAENMQVERTEFWCFEADLAKEGTGKALIRRRILWRVRSRCPTMAESEMSLSETRMRAMA
jgi:hypothetical protein